MKTYYKKYAVIWVAIGAFVLGLETLFIMEEINIGDNYYDDLVTTGIVLFTTLTIALRGRIKIKEKENDVE